MQDIYLISLGRQFRYHGSKIVVGRDEKSNNQLKIIKKKQDTFIEVLDYGGPSALIKGKAKNEVINFAGSLILSYSDYPGEIGCVIINNKIKRKLKKLPQDEIQKARIC